MEFAQMNVANSAEMIHAIVKNFDASFSCNIRNSILDYGAFSKLIFSSGREGTEGMLTNDNIRQEKLITKHIQNGGGDGEGVL